MDIKCVRRLIMIERRSFKVMLEWSTPSISDGDWIRKIIAESGNMGSDVSFANMYLLREKYDIQICSYRGFLLRHYNGYYGRKGYTFPIGTGNLEKAQAGLAVFLPFKVCILLGQNGVPGISDGAEIGKSVV